MNALIMIMHIPSWCSMLASTTALATYFCVMLCRHHQTYVTNLIKALEKAPQLKEMDLNELQRAIGTGKVPQDVQGAVRNHAGVRRWGSSSLHSRPCRMHSHTPKVAEQ